jgi:hypothetical protein
LRVLCSDFLDQHICSVGRSIVDDGNVRVEVEVENLTEHGRDIAGFI